MGKPLTSGTNFLQHSFQDTIKNQFICSTFQTQVATINVLTSHIHQWDQPFSQPPLDSTKAHALSRKCFLKATASCLHSDSTLHPAEARQKPTINTFYSLVLPFYTRNHFYSLLIYLVSLFPVNPKASPGQETSNSLTCYMRNPTLYAQLTHYCINPWKSSGTLKETQHVQKQSYTHPTNCSLPKMVTTHICHR